MEATHDPARAQHPDGRHEEAVYISRRPSWATETRIKSSECVMHTWTAPTLAEASSPDDPDLQAFIRLGAGAPRPAAEHLTGA